MCLIFIDTFRRDGSVSLIINWLGKGKQGVIGLKREGSGGKVSADIDILSVYLRTNLGGTLNII